MKCPRCSADNPDTSQFCGTCAAHLGAVGGPGFSVTKTMETPAQAASPDTIIAGKYRILEELGRGGMGVVYKAEDIRLNRPVALKFLPPQWTSEQAARERFIHEARAASALDHPNICNIHEIGETDDKRMFIAMACYEGESLREKIRRGPLKTDEAIGIAMQVARGMAKAHQKGIVHRDIKPANILITGDGVAKVVDFGLAKLAGQVRLTREGSTVGTVAYMSPEQVRGEAVNQRTDIWSLGVALYEMVTGRLPFKGDLEQSLVHSILTSDPEAASTFQKDLPKGLDQVILKSLMKNPSARYQSMDELEGDLKAIADGLKPLHAKQGLFRGRVLGIKKIHMYLGLACVGGVAGIMLMIGPPARRTVYDSIAVLPLENLSKDPGREVYSEGLADELIARFYKVSAFRVLQLNAVRDFRAAKKSYKDLWREYKVRAVLDAAFLCVGDRVRITTKLVDAETEQPLWGDSYERDTMDIIALQADISQAVVRAVQAKITPQEHAALVSSPKVNPDAYDAYLEGKKILYITARTAEQAKSGLTYFQKATEIDHEFAPAYFWLVRYYERLLSENLVAFSDALEYADVALNKGLALDSESYEAYLARGELELMKWKWERAAELFKRALELSPGDPWARVRYADVLQTLGRFDQAVEVGRRLVEEDMERYYGWRINLAWKLIDAKKTDDGIKMLLDVVRDQPTLPAPRNVLALAYAHVGMFDEAVAEAERSLSLLPINEKGFYLINNALVYALAHHKKEALKFLDDYLAFNKDKPIDSYTISELYAVLGDKEEAFEWLEKAFQEHNMSIFQIKTDATMDGIRSDPRFGEYLKRAGFEK